MKRDLRDEINFLGPIYFQAVVLPAVFARNSFQQQFKG